MRDDDFDDSSDPNARPGLPVDPGRLWLSLRRDWRWVPLAGVIWGVLGVGVAFALIKHVYQSEAVLIWEPKGSTGGFSNDDKQLATQAGSLRLPGALRRVKQRLSLPYPIEVLVKQFEVLYDTRSNLVKVQANGSSANDAALLANTMVDVFLEQQRDISRARAQEVVDALQKDSNVARAELLRSRQAYDTFRNEQGVTDIDAETKLAIDSVAALKTQQQVAAAEALALEAQAQEIGGAVKKQSKTSVQAANSTNPDALALATKRSELAGARARFSADHPRIAQLQAEISALEARVSKGSGVVSLVTTGLNPEYQSLQSSLSSAKAEQEAALKRKQSFADSARTTEERLAGLAAIQGKVRMLQSDMELAQNRLNDLESQLGGAKDAVRSPELEWRVLTPAIAPDAPERSKRRVVAVGMPIMGMLVALFVLLLRPIMNGRVYTAREAGYWANLPVIGSSTWPRNRETFFALVDELGDQGSAARGYTLVLGATGREKPLAEELAFLLGDRAHGNGAQPQVEVSVAHAQPSGRPAGGARDGGGIPNVTTAGHPFMPDEPGRPVSRSEALVPVPRSPNSLPVQVQGTHAWLGTTEGPALRRAARMADRVIVLLTSGAELFTSVAGLRTRLGREHGVGVVLLGVTPELLKLPDRAGDVDGFWRSRAPRAAALANSERM